MHTRIRRCLSVPASGATVLTLSPSAFAVEFDTTDNRFRDELLTRPLEIQKQAKSNNASVAIPDEPGLGVEPDLDFIRHYEISSGQV